MVGELAEPNLFQSKNQLLNDVKSVFGDFGNRSLGRGHAQDMASSSPRTFLCGGRNHVPYDLFSNQEGQVGSQ